MHCHNKIPINSDSVQCMYLPCVFYLPDKSCSVGFETFWFGSKSHFSFLDQIRSLIQIKLLRFSDIQPFLQKINCQPSVNFLKICYISFLISFYFLLFFSTILYFDQFTSGFLWLISLSLYLFLFPLLCNIILILYPCLPKNTFESRPDPSRHAPPVYLYIYLYL